MEEEIAKLNRVRAWAESFREDWMINYEVNARIGEKQEKMREYLEKYDLVMTQAEVERIEKLMKYTQQEIRALKRVRTERIINGTWNAR
jgi:hypothetical protein